MIGIRPDADRAAAHPGLSAVVVTNLGEARNSVIVHSADVVIVVGGSWGARSSSGTPLSRCRCQSRIPVPHGRSSRPPR